MASSSKILSTIDHRFIGAKQSLFFFNELSQGSCFFLPRGARIYNKLIEYIRQEYKQRKYEEVITPNFYQNQLWKTSGHWDHYEKNMIKFNIDEKEFSLKPMNCPGHCVMFQHLGIRTSDQLPIRWSEFGILHRNELSGTLLGLIRVRRFQQDDAHIFCTSNQVESEVQNCLQFAKQVYSKFDFTFETKLSLRPENYLGDESVWEIAEQSLRLALDKSGLKWDEQKLEGAFYGPKIDLVVKDCRQKSYQCATIQLDFQLPERFDLKYKNLDNKSIERPVIIHRAIFGSLERFLAMVTENCEGRWPFWLSPLQAQIIPIHPNLNVKAKLICEKFREAGFWTDCDLRSNITLNAKIRDASITPYNLTLIVGENEIKTDSVNCRLRQSNMNNEVSGTMNNKKIAHNTNINVDKLIELFGDFERRQINRADLELLAFERERNQN